jgi:hypothetical protein
LAREADRHLHSTTDFQKPARRPGGFWGGWGLGRDILKGCFPTKKPEHPEGPD